MKQWILKKTTLILTIFLICSTVFVFNQIEIYAGSIDINGVHTFYNSSFTHIDGSDTATSNDGYFVLKGSKYKLNFDDVSAWMDDGDCVSEETVYFEVTGVGSLESFVLDSVDLGEYTDGEFKNVYVEGYANGEKIFTTEAYSNPKDDIAVPNFPLDFTEAEDKVIDSFRIYYTKGAGVGFAHWDFNIYSFTISSASTDPVLDTTAPEPVTNVRLSDTDTTPGVDGRDFTVDFDDSIDDLSTGMTDVSSYDIYLYKDGEEPTDKDAMDLLSSSSKVTVKTINRTSGDDGVHRCLGSEVTTDSKGQQLTAGDYWVIVIAKDSAGNYSFAKTDTKTSIEGDVSVSLSASNNTLDENAGSTTLTATLSSELDQETIFILGFSGTAVNGTDYTISDNKIIIPEGQTSGTITLTAHQDSDYESNETIIVDITSVTGMLGTGIQQVTVDITDNDSQPTVELSLSGNNFSENGGTTEITATLSNKSYQDVTVNLSYSGTAASGADFTKLDQVVIPAGNLSQSITITGENDTDYEGDETVIADISGVTNGTEGSNKQVIATLTDDDLQPKVSLNVTPLTFSENGGTTTVTATLSNKSYQDVTVNLNLTGTATATETETETDYTASNTTITIPVGELSGSIVLTANNDTVYEGDETVIAKISSVQNGTYDDTQQAVATITDDESMPVVELSISAPSLAESGGYVIVRGSISEKSGKDVRVDLDFLGTATRDSDYKTTVNYINISAGSTSNTCKITGLEDTAYELPETVIVSISNVTDGVVGTVQQVSATITDNDAAPKVTLKSDKTSISEALVNDEMKVTATLSNISYEDVTVELDLTGTAIDGSDYSVILGSDPLTIVIPAGSLTGTLTFAVLNDAVYEGNEPFSVAITNVTNGTEDGQQKVDLLVIDNEIAPSVTLSIAPDTFSENRGTTTVTATLSNKSYQDVTVNLNLTGTAKGTDYTVSNTTITIPAGTLSGSIMLTANNNDSYSGDKTVIIDIASVVNGTENAKQQVTATLTEDETAPSVTLSKSADSMAENGGSITLTATLSGTSTEAITVNLAHTGTAAEGEDYTASDNKIVIPAGSSSGTVTITGKDDSTFEDVETIIVDITSVTGAVENGTQQQTASIIDDDTVSKVTLSSDKASVSENEGTATITATLSNKSYQDVTVNLSFTGTAVGGGTDYTASSSTIDIPAGSLSGTLTITGVNNSIYEGNKPFAVDIISVINGTENGTQKVELTVMDDETPPLVNLSLSPSSFSENGETTTLTATLSNKSNQDVTVALSFGGTAVVAADYTGAAATITIPAGSISNSITLTGKNDTDYEGDETVIANISNVINGAVGSAKQVTATITDDDTPPEVTLSVVGSSLNENGGTATITVTLSALSSKDTIVELGFSGTASTMDYNKSLSGSITIPAGSLSRSIILKGIDDAKDEANETIIVDIASVTGASESGTQQVILTIIDDDEGPAVSINAPSVVEGDTGTANLTYTVTLSKASDQTVTIEYATADGTATVSDHDYLAQAVTPLIFAPGETSRTIIVTVIGDTSVEADETVLVTLSNPVNATITTGLNTGTGTIINNDLAVIKVSGNKMNIVNGDTTPSSLDYTDFTSTEVSGGTISKEFTIENSGNATLVLAGASPNIEISGTNASDFSVVTSPIPSIKGGDKTTFTIKFDPSTSGIKSARITIGNNDNSNNPFVFDIKGEGKVSTSSSPSSPSTSTPPTPPTSLNNDKVDVIFNDEGKKAATTEVKTKDDVKTTVVTLDDSAVKENLAKMEKEKKDGDKVNTVIVPINNQSNVVAVELNGELIKNMENKEAVLEIKTEEVSYAISAAQINIEAVSAELGAKVELKDIKVNINIADPSKDTIKIVEDTANKNRYQLVVKPVDFEITCTSGSKTVDVSHFNDYVERTVAIPEGVDPQKITTGVVVNKDGTFSHVPTTVSIVDGKYYAKINSRTNSTYTVIWNPVTFKDVEKHWSKKDVNEVGSRLIDNGVGSGNFAPDRAITRAEFASMLVKALGLEGKNFTNQFSDVKSSDPCYKYIYTAYEYGILTGYSNGKFGPQDLITREQAMAMVTKAMNIAGMDVNVSGDEVSEQLKSFADSDKIATYAKQAAIICVKNGIFGGDNKGMLTPKGNFTRAESATVIIKLLKQSGLI